MSEKSIYFTSIEGLLSEIRLAYSEADRTRQESREKVVKIATLTEEVGRLHEEIDRLKALIKQPQKKKRLVKNPTGRNLKMNKRYKVNAKELNKLMDMKGVSQSDIGELLGKHHTSVSNYITGRCMISMADLKTIADLFEIDVAGIVEK